MFLEANQFGVPGIGSEECGIEDAIADNVSGLLVPQKDYEAIANAARYILKNKEHFKKGAIQWQTQFLWEETIQRYIQSYQQDSRLLSFR